MIQSILDKGNDVMPKRSPKTKTMPTTLIAPCGMNCRLCRAYVRDKNSCPGCRGDDRLKPQYCVACRIKNCDHIKKDGAKYCFSCDRFPCTRLKQLDKRYRTKYGMSMMANLKTIEQSGIRQFIRTEKEKWTCPGCGAFISVHKPECLCCGHQWQ